MLNTTENTRSLTTNEIENNNMIKINSDHTSFKKNTIDTLLQKVDHINELLHTEKDTEKITQLLSQKKTCWDTIFQQAELNSQYNYKNRSLKTLIFSILKIDLQLRALKILNETHNTKKLQEKHNKEKKHLLAVLQQKHQINKKVLANVSYEIYQKYPDLYTNCYNLIVQSFILNRHISNEHHQKIEKYRYFLFQEFMTQLAHHQSQ